MSVGSSALNVERSAPRGAVFLSYASQDTEPVARIAEALRAAGVEVWFDKDELVGGDTWDAKIRGQIASCALFVPVISASTQARLEGYFRIEWKLAAQRTHAMAEEKAFLLPVVIDDTRDGEAKVPAEFKAVQWTRLPGVESHAVEKFCARVGKLLGAETVSPIADRAAGSEVGAPLDGAHGRGRATPLRKPARQWLWPAVAAAVVLGGIVVWRAELKPPASGPAPGAAVKTIAPLSPARELAERASAMSLKKYNSTADDFAAAEGLIKQALALDQNDAQIWAISSHLNGSIRTRGFDDAPARREAARSQAERALKLDPNSIEGLFALGRWQRDNDPDRAVAEKTFLAVLARAPEHDGALQSLGTMYGRQNRVEEALAIFERAARNPASLPLARYGQYVVLFSHRRFEEAERALRESIAAESSANSVTGLAMVLLTAKGDAAAAVRALAGLPAPNRSEHRAVWMTAFAQLAARDPEAALATLRRLSADYVQDNWFAGPTAYWVGRAHSQAGRVEAARIAFEAGLTVMDAKLKTGSDDYALHVARGELLAWLGREEEALREARTATELAGGDEIRLWFYSPVRIYAALGRADDAVPLLEKFAGRNPRTAQWPLTAALLRVDPLWDKLRGDPRFQALCAEPPAKKKETDTVPLSEAAQLAARALGQFTKTSFTRDDLLVAEDLAKRATDKEPDNAAAWGVRAGVQSAWIFRNWDAGEKRLQETQALANKALALDAGEPEAQLALAQVPRKQGAAGQAETLLRKALAAHAKHIRLARSLGSTLSFAGRNDEALPILARAAELAPRDPLVRYDLAMAHANYGGRGADPAKLASALEQLDAAIAIEPFASALLLKATLLGGWRGDLPVMRATLDRLDALPLGERSEDRAVALSIWAGLIERRPDRVEAAAALTARNYFEDAVLALRPKAWSLALAHRVAGKENLARRDWQAAETVLRQRLKDDPANAVYQVELAITLAWLDQREEAARLVGAVEPLWREELGYGSSEMLTRYYAAAGDAVKTAAYLAESIDSSVFQSRQSIARDPWWDKVRGAPEFVAALQAAEARAK